MRDIVFETEDAIVAIGREPANTCLVTSVPSVLYRRFGNTVLSPPSVLITLSPALSYPNVEVAVPLPAERRRLL